jgi:hypothetical protein
MAQNSSKIAFLYRPHFFRFVQSVVVAWAITAVVGFSPVKSERLYGNAQLSVSDSRSEASNPEKSGRVYATTLLNIEDMLFYKNRMRLAWRFDWRDDTYSDERDYHPTYYFNLDSYGYHFDASLSPYKKRTERLGDSTGLRIFDVFYRDWRSTLGINIPRYPQLNVMYSRYRVFDRQSVNKYNLTQQTLVLESGYFKEQYSARANYSRMQRDNDLPAQVDDIIRSFNGTFSATSPSSIPGLASFTYNYYNTERDISKTTGSRSKTHSLSAIASSPFYRHLQAGVSYSGRFSSSTQIVSTLNRRSENMSTSLSFVPTAYFDCQAVKSYQIDGPPGSYEILEYVAFSGNLTRYLRQGVDTRLSATRTNYQQSNRVAEYRDSLGGLDSVRQLDHFAVETYYGSIGFWPREYVNVVANLSLTHDAESLEPERRYLMSSAIDGRFYLTAKLEGRASYSTSYLGRKLRLGHAYQDNVNVGLSWLPRGNLNLSATIIVTQINTGGVSNRSENLSLYANYAFRRAFSFYISYNEQEQRQETLGGVSETLLSLSRPQTFSTQLLVHVGRRSSLTLGYSEGQNRSSSIAGGDQVKTWQGTYNLQI